MTVTVRRLKYSKIPAVRLPNILSPTMKIRKGGEGRLHSPITFSASSADIAPLSKRPAVIFAPTGNPQSQPSKIAAPEAPDTPKSLSETLPKVGETKDIVPERTSISDMTI